VQPDAIEGKQKETIVEAKRETTDGDEQLKLWNGPAGRAWIDGQEMLDRMFTPFEKLLADEVAFTGARRVLDVGCGTGITTLAVARLPGMKGRAVGIDISEPMIAVARERATRERLAATFIAANAQTHALEPASFDMMISRFGVMFFDDFVQAFTNLRRAAADGAATRFIVWRSAAENPFMTTAERAAAPFLPNLPPRRPGGPGQFALADPQRVHSILQESGWSEIDIRPLDVACTFSEKELNVYLMRFGPVGMVLQDADERTRTQVSEAVRAAFDPFVHGTEVRFTAACWLIAARNRAGNS
jgi:SAM-dependent methyltransferase